MLHVFSGVRVAYLPVLLCLYYFMFCCVYLHSMPDIYSWITARILVPLITPYTVG